MTIENVKMWAKLHPDRVKARRKVYYATNKEKILEQCRAYKVANKEHLTIKQREYDSTPERKAIRYGYRKTYRLRKYGLSEMAYNLMLCLQRFSCAICKTPFGKDNIHVDHCHDTGEVRGLLCFKCNAGLGLFSNSDLLESAEEYLQ